MARRCRFPIFYTSSLMTLLVSRMALAQDKFGDVNFPISCSAEAPVRFNRAAAMLYSFFFPEMVKAFRALPKRSQQVRWPTGRLSQTLYRRGNRSEKRRWRARLLRASTCATSGVIKVG
jgi:hypothetical protein